MGFDQEPEGRWLLHHSESDTLFEELWPGKADECIATGCDDVTNLPEWEARFKEQSK